MIRLKDKQFGLPFERIWFWDGSKVKSSAILLRYLRCKPDRIQSIKAKKSTDVNHTLIHDLTLDENELFSTLNKNYRYEVRRASKEENEITVYFADLIRNNPQILSEFERAYNAFCDTLGNESVRENYNHDQTCQCITQDGAVLTKAVQGGAVVYHLYYVDGRSAVLDYSVSDFRDGDVDKASAGRLNKLLHWEDMKMFKAEGYLEYDWGNVSTSDVEQFNGIDKFKAGFGGKLIEQQSAFVGNSVLGTLAVMYIDIKKRQKGRS